MRMVRAGIGVGWPRRRQVLPSVLGGRQAGGLQGRVRVDDDKELFDKDKEMVNDLLKGLAKKGKRDNSALSYALGSIEGRRATLRAQAKEYKEGGDPLLATVSLERHDELGRLLDLLWRRFA